MLFLLVLSSFCLIFTLIMYLRYAKRTVHFITTVIVLCIWYITFLVSILVPYDIFLSYYPDLDEISLLENIYRVCYVILLLMSCIIIPIMIEYERAGDFTIKERLQTALKRNIIFYTVEAVIGLLVLGFLIYKKQLHL